MEDQLTDQFQLAFEDLSLDLDDDLYLYNSMFLQKQFKLDTK